MNIDKAFPSKYLKAADFDDVDTPLTITRVVMEQISPDERAKPIIYFQELEKGMNCNSTNKNTIKKLYGEETDNWIGKTITLWINHDVQYKQDTVSAIRVRSRAPVPVSEPVRRSEQASQRIGDPQTLAFVLTVEGLDAAEQTLKLLEDFGYASLEAVPTAEREQFITFIQTIMRRIAATA